MDDQPVLSMPVQGVQLGNAEMHGLAFQGGVCHLMRDSLVISAQGQAGSDVSALRFQLLPVFMEPMDTDHNPPPFDGGRYRIVLDGPDSTGTRSYRTLCFHSRDDRDYFYAAIRQLKPRPRA